jgi:hypothetical protein
MLSFFLPYFFYFFDFFDFAVDLLPPPSVFTGPAAWPPAWN